MKQHKTYELQWSQKHGRYVLCYQGGTVAVTYPHSLTKRKVESLARRYVSWRAPSKLLIKNRDGTIAKGGRGEASYGCDSTRAKG